MPAIAFFDFDGTITTRDTLFEIIRFQKGATALYTGMLLLSPALALFKLKLLSRQTMKQLVLRYYFRGAPAAAFRQRCEDFCNGRLPSILRGAALTAIRDHISEGRQVVVVTASAEDWVAPWCRSMGIACIGTRLEVQDGRLTGNIAGLNCNGDEKVARIRALYDLGAFGDIYAYGDSSGDKAMLALAGIREYKPFRDV